MSISNSDRSIQGAIFDVAYNRTGIPADKITRSKNNDFIVTKEGYISVVAAIACEANDLADFDQTDIAVTVM